MAPGCTVAEQLTGWQRHATAAERAAADPPQPGPDDVALVVVIACQTHKISAELATGIHQAVCAAPPVCDCTPAFAEPDPSGARA